MKNYDFLKKISILVFAFREKREMSEFVRSRARSDVGISVSCQQTRLFGWGNSLGNHLEIVLYVFRFCRNVNFRLRNQRWEIRFFFFVHPLLVCAFHLPRFRFLFLLRWKWMNITLSTIAEHFFLFFFFQFRSRPLSRKSCGLLSMIDTFQKKKCFIFSNRFMFRFYFVWSAEWKKRCQVHWNAMNWQTATALSLYFVSIDKCISFGRIKKNWSFFVAAFARRKKWEKNVRPHSD